MPFLKRDRQLPGLSRHVPSWGAGKEQGSLLPLARRRTIEGQQAAAGDDADPGAE